MEGPYAVQGFVLNSQKVPVAVVEEEVVEGAMVVVAAVSEVGEVVEDIMTTEAVAVDTIVVVMTAGMTGIDTIETGPEVLDVTQEVVVAAETVIQEGVPVEARIVAVRLQGNVESLSVTADQGHRRQLEMVLRVHNKGRRVEVGVDHLKGIDVSFILYCF